MFSILQAPYLVAYNFFPKMLWFGGSFVKEKLRRLNAVLKFIANYILTQFSDTTINGL